MGGPGGGRYTSKSKAWDICEFAADLLTYLERGLYEAETHPMTRDWIEQQQDDLKKLQGQFKDALDRERQG